MKNRNLFLLLVLIGLFFCLSPQAVAEEQIVTGETVHQLVQQVVSGETVLPRRGGGGGGGAPAYYLETDILGAEERYRISADGALRETIEVTSADGILTISIPKGTIALDREGKRLKSMDVIVDEVPPAPLKNSYIIGLAHDFGPDGATFAPAITLTWSYDPDALPEGLAEQDLVLAYYDKAAGEWVELDCVVDTVTNIIVASVGHFTTFAIIGTVTPAAFAVSDLSISPTEVDIGEEITISVLVTNTGDVTGTYQATLKLNDEVVATEQVTLAGGASQEVIFTISKDAAGTYTVNINGLSDTFKVRVAPPPPPPPPPVLPPVERINWWLIGGSIAGGILVGALIFFLVRKRAA